MRGFWRLSSRFGLALALAGLLTAALAAVLVGAVGTAGLFLRATQHTPRLLLLIMAVWVFSPFAALVWADAASRRWPALIRTTLNGVMLFVALASLAVYGADAVWPANRSPPSSTFSSRRCRGC